MSALEPTLAERQADALERIAVLLREHPALDLAGLKIGLHLFAPRAGQLAEFDAAARQHADSVLRAASDAFLTVQARFGPLLFSLQTTREHAPAFDEIPKEHNPHG
jgi:hypothetical protein